MLLCVAGQQNIYFDLRSILGWLGTSFLHATIIMTMVMCGADSLEVDRIDGHTWSLQQNGILMFSIVVVTVHLQLAVVLDQWMWMHHVAIWGSIGAWDCIEWRRCRVVWKAEQQCKLLAHECTYSILLVVYLGLLTAGCCYDPLTCQCLRFGYTGNHFESLPSSFFPSWYVIVPLCSVIIMPIPVVCVCPP